MALESLQELTGNNQSFPFFYSWNPCYLQRKLDSGYNCQYKIYLHTPTCTSIHNGVLIVFLVAKHEYNK